MKLVQGKPSWVVFEELDKELFRSMILHHFAKCRMKRTKAHVRRWNRWKISTKTKG